MPITFLDVVLIFIGSGLGGIARFLLAHSISLKFASSFPYGTLLVNICGSFLIGLISIIIFSRVAFIAPHLRFLLLIGFLGGFTTFSTFAWETVYLFEVGEVLTGLLNIFLSLGLSIIMTWLGIILGRLL